MDTRQIASYRLKIGQAFQPSAPINKLDLFAGRSKQIQDVLRTITQVGQHTIIFGERGVGKTSLAKVLSEVATDFGLNLIIPDSINCDSTDNFHTIWYKVFREIISYLKVRNIETSSEIIIDPDDLFYETPDDVRYVFNLLPYPAIVILDELDRLQDDKATTLLADTIKTLSDHATPVTLILIGIADSIDELLKEHRSIQRSLISVHLHRMFPYELREIIVKGMEKTGITFDEEATNSIIQLSSGLPHYTHTLAFHAAHYVIDNRKTKVGVDDVTAAIQTFITTPGNLLSAYEKATSSSYKATLFKEILLACALAEKSDLGFFAAASIRGPLEEITGKKYKIPAFSGHLSAFCSEERGNILQKIGEPRRFRFRFADSLMQPFVIIHGLSKGLIDESMLSRIYRPADKSLFH